MADYGMEAWNEVSQIKTLRFTDRITRIIGSRSTGTSDGLISVPDQGTPWFQILETNPNTTKRYGPTFTVVEETNSIRWTFVYDGRLLEAKTFIYGVY